MRAISTIKHYISSPDYDNVANSAICCSLQPPYPSSPSCSLLCNDFSYHKVAGKSIFSYQDSLPNFLHCIKPHIGTKAVIGRTSTIVVKVEAKGS